MKPVAPCQSRNCIALYPVPFNFARDTPYYLHGYLEKEARRYLLNSRNGICMQIHQLRRESTRVAHSALALFFQSFKRVKQRDWDGLAESDFLERDCVAARNQRMRSRSIDFDIVAG